jgi:hypothetical protein
MGTGIAAAALALLTAAGTSAAPPSSGCPQGFEEVAVSQAENEGYVPIPRLVDNAGNGNGEVCRRALGDGVFHRFPGRPDTIYQWRDDDLAPASS